MPPPATSTSGRSSRGVIFCAASYAFWPSSVKVKARVCTARARRGAAARERERGASARAGARSAAAVGARAAEADMFHEPDAFFLRRETRKLRDRVPGPETTRVA